MAVIKGVPSSTAPFFFLFLHHSVNPGVPPKGGTRRPGQSSHLRTHLDPKRRFATVREPSTLKNTLHLTRAQAIRIFP